MRSAAAAAAAAKNVAFPKASRADHHGNIATEPMITAEASAVISGVFKNRWRTLMSVDDLIGDVIAACEELGVADNTYIFYSSDHGFQLGEFNILMDKRNVYDWDTRIHLLARGQCRATLTTLSHPPLPAENLLEDTDELLRLRPPPLDLRRGDECSLEAVVCCSLLLLTCALRMTSPHFKGPGIKPGSTWVQPATQVDIAPTFLGLAGLAGRNLPP